MNTRIDTELERCLETHTITGLDEIERHKYKGLSTSFNTPTKTGLETNRLVLGEPNRHSVSKVCRNIYGHMNG